MSSKYIIADNDPEIVYFLNELKAQGEIVNVL